MSTGPAGGRRRLPLSLRRRAVPWDRQRPTWREARPAVISGALKRPRRVRPATGTWWAPPVTCAPAVRWRGPWRDRRWCSGGTPGAARWPGPGSARTWARRCGTVPSAAGTLVCHWHGLALDGGPFAGWEPFPVHDDGVLLWIRLDAVGGEAPLDAPVVPVRPDRALTAVYTGVGTCEPEDVVANRLDPWHGAWFHPYSFVDLTVAGAPDGSDGSGDAFTVDVSFKVAGRLVVPVRAEFTAPEPRTVVMRITEGEGAGSVVESHATPLGTDDRGRPRTAVVEAVVAGSDRPGFALARGAAPLLRPLVRAAAGRLWRDDLAYAERRWALRSTGRFPD
ncbi:DUF5914 domain-containing protein [Streptomyces heliomycini]